MRVPHRAIQILKKPRILRSTLRANILEAQCTLNVIPSDTFCLEPRIDDLNLAGIGCKIHTYIHKTLPMRSRTQRNTTKTTKTQQMNLAVVQHYSKRTKN